MPKPVADSTAVKSPAPAAATKKASHAKAKAEAAGAGMVELYERAVEIDEARGELPEALEIAKDKGIFKGMKEAWSASKANEAETSGSLVRGGQVGKALYAVYVGANAAMFVDQSITAVHSARKALKTGKSSDVSAAVSDAADAGRTGAMVLHGSLEIGKDVEKVAMSYRAAAAAFKTAVPRASKALVRRVALKAAQGAFIAPAKEALSDAIAGAKQAVANVVHGSGRTIANAAGTTGRSSAKVALSSGEKAAAHAAVEAAEHASAGVMARAAGRLAPGVNVAIAAYDVYQMRKDLHDPKASTARKVTSCITATASCVAATNIPIVSQVAGIVSSVSALVGAFYFR